MEPSCFLLELDTTGPFIQINAPMYTVAGIPTHITVVANEQISPNPVTLYLEDRNQKRYPQTWLHKGDRLEGIVDLNLVPAGFVKVVAQVRDTVFNLSNEATTFINLLESGGLDITTEDFQRPTEAGETTRVVETYANAERTTTAALNRPLEAEETARGIEVTEDVLPSR